MGQVFLARSPGGRLVAVKVIRSELAENAEFRARFAREVDAARKVGGLFTAQVVDANLAGPVPWIVTAYVPGPSLADAVAENGPLPAASVAALAAGLAEGLSAIHAVGVVHRDLKPSNVLLADDGPRIIDFGISLAAEATTALTGTGLMIGSPGFMSPEQAQGHPVGPPSDLFSLGGVLIFAATGEGPFGTGDTVALLYRVVHGKPNLDGVSVKLRPLIRQCMAADPQRRPSAARFLAGLNAAYPSAAPSATPSATPSAAPSTAPPADALPTHTSVPPLPAVTPPSRSVSRPRPAWLPWAAAGAAAVVAGIIALIAIPGSSHGNAPAATGSSRSASATHPVSRSPSAAASSRSPSAAASSHPDVGLLSPGQLKPGDCLTGSDLPLGNDNDWPSSVTAVPCGQQHRAEVILSDNHYWPQALAYPGDNAINNQTDTGCNNAYTAYVGIPDSRSMYTWDAIQPSASTWLNGDRGLECVAFYATKSQPGGVPISGSIKGSRR